MNKRKTVLMGCGFFFLTATHLSGQSFFDIVQTGAIEEVQQAIDAGADINARDSEGWTALMIAVAANQNPEVITALVRAGAEVNARDSEGWTALMVAASTNENSEVTTTLIAAGADGRAKDLEDKTAFDYAKENPALVGTDVYWQLNDAQ